MKSKVTFTGYLHVLKASKKGLRGKNGKKEEGGRFNKGEHNLEFN